MAILDYSISITDRSTKALALDTVNPCKGSVDYPAPGQDDGAHEVGSFDDFDCQPINVRNRSLELLPAPYPYGPPAFAIVIAEPSMMLAVDSR